MEGPFRSACLKLPTLVLLIFFSTLPSPAVAEQEIRVSILSVDDSAFPNVTAVVLADRIGLPITEVDLAHLSIEETGAPASPLAVRRAVDSNLPLAVVLTLDVSGSMAGESLDRAKTSAIALIDSLQPSDRASVLTFSDEVRIEQPFSNDKQALRSTLSQLRATDRGTALYDAVVESARVASESGLSRRAIVFLSDGIEFGPSSRVGRTESLRLAQEQGSAFFVIGVGNNFDRPYLEELAGRSKGRFFDAFHGSQIPRVYSGLEELLRSSLVVTFRATSPADISERSVRMALTRADAIGIDYRQYRSKREDSHQAIPAPSTSLAGQTEPAAPSLPLVAVLVPSLGIAAAVALMARSRRRSAPEKTGGADHGAVLKTASLERIPTATAITITPHGIGGGAAMDVSQVPVTVGSGQACQARVAAVSGVAPEHVRIWTRDGRLLLHHLASGYTTTVRGRNVIWASLGAGEEAEIGPYTLRCLGTLAPGSSTRATTE